MTHTHTHYQKDRMEKTIEAVRASFNAVRTGRANPSMLDRIEVLTWLSLISMIKILIFFIQRYRKCNLFLWYIAAFMFQIDIYNDHSH